MRTWSLAHGMSEYILPFQAVASVKGRRVEGWGGAALGQCCQHVRSSAKTMCMSTLYGHQIGKAPPMGKGGLGAKTEQAQDLIKRQKGCGPSHPVGVETFVLHKTLGQRCPGNSLTSSSSLGPPRRASSVVSGVGLCQLEMAGSGGVAANRGRTVRALWITTTTNDHSSVTLSSSKYGIPVVAPEGTPNGCIWFLLWGFDYCNLLVAVS